MRMSDLGDYPVHRMEFRRGKYVSAKEEFSIPNGLELNTVKLELNTSLSL